MSIVTTPTQQGVTRLPTAAHLRTNILNGNVRIASQTGPTGAQPAFYELQGGSITSNVKVAMPNLTADDTLVTQNANIAWGGSHNFTQGLQSQGPIVTSSSITGSSISATNMTVSSALASGGNISSGDTLTAKNHVIAGQNITAGAALNVGSTATITSDTSIGGNSTTTGSAQVNGQRMMAGFSLATGGSPTASLGTYTNTHSAVNLQPSTAVTGNLTLRNDNGGTNDGAYFGIVTGISGGHGCMIGTASGQLLGFHGGGPSPQQPSHGSVTASNAYGTNEASMLNDAYHCLRIKGLLQ